MMNVHFGAQITPFDVAQAKADKRDRDMKVANPGIVESLKISKARHIANQLGYDTWSRSAKTEYEQEKAKTYQKLTKGKLEKKYKEITGNNWQT